MTKKKERTYATSEDEVKSLRRQIAGLKSYYTAVVETKKELEQTIADLMQANEKLRASDKERESTIARLEAQNVNVKGELFVLRSEVEYHNSLPLFKRIFHRIETNDLNEKGLAK